MSASIRWIEGPWKQANRCKPTGSSRLESGFYDSSRLQPTTLRHLIHDISLLGLTGHEPLLALFQLPSELLEPVSKSGRRIGHQFVLLHPDVFLYALT